MSRYFLTALLAALLVGLTGQSCTFHLGAPSDGGVFKSVNKGREWQQIVTIIGKNNRTQTFGNVDVVKLLVDPYDANTIYAATKRFGLFQTTNGGDSWVRIFAQNATVNDVAPDPRSRCVIYVVTANQLLKTSDCAQTWLPIFNETRSRVTLTSIAVDSRDPSSIYFTNSAGELVHSGDYGTTWATVFTMTTTGFKKILFDKADHNTLFLGTDDAGVLRSGNQAAQWEDISTPIKTSENSTAFRFLGTLSGHNGIWYVSKNSIFRTFNGGATWDRLALLTPPNTTSILAATFNPSNDDEVYYATATTLYHSTDDGQSWTARPLPTARAASYLAVDPYNGNTIYLGAQIYQNTPFKLY